MPVDQSSDSLVDALGRRGVTKLRLTGGRARYLRVAETGGLIGLISPLRCKLCRNCNRLLVSATGKLSPCMGDDGAVDLRTALHHAPDRIGGLIRTALDRKPRAHRFGGGARSARSATAAVRHMSVPDG